MCTQIADIHSCRDLKVQKTPNPTLNFHNEITNGHIVFIHSFENKLLKY